VEVTPACAALEFGGLEGAILCWCGESGHLDPDQLSNHLCGISFAGPLGQLLGLRGSQGLIASGEGCRGLAVRDGWRGYDARHRRSAKRQAVGRAVSATAAEQRDGAGAQAMAVDCSINPADRVGVGRPVEDWAR